MPLTKDQIFAVADTLDTEGLSPTLANVRKRLGRGSFTTIADVMTEWKAKKAAKESPVRDPAPAPVIEKLSELGLDIWALAQAIANGRLATEREALQGIQMRLEHEKAEAVELADHLAAELESHKAQIAELELGLASAQEQTEALRIQLLESNERSAMANARTQEISKRADDLNVELARVHAQHAELIKALATRMESRQLPLDIEPT